jgi:pimeloyl-ACP methyl ester carboxylesterase
MQWADSVCAAMAAIGPVSAIVAHSVGAGAVLIAARKKLASQCLVLISPLTSIVDATNYFAKQVGVGRKAIEMMRTLAWQHAEPSGSRYAPNWEALFQSPYLVPTLIVHDEDDVVIPIDHSVWLSGHWPLARLVSTQGLGHGRILKELTVLQTITAFVGGVVDAQGTLVQELVQELVQQAGA